MCNCNNTSQTTICQTQIPCDQTDCSCPVKDLSTDCILYTGDTLECSGIESQTVLTELIQQLDAYICTAIAGVSSSINLINVGTGTQIYKGVDVLGKREIRSLKTTNPIITIGLAGESKEIAFGINESELTDFITDIVTPGVGGSGIQDYVARWTPNGSTLGTGIIRDNNTSIGINTAPNAATVMTLTTSGNEDKGIYSINNSTSTTNKNAIYGLTSGINTAQNRGLEGIAQDSTSLNVGVVGIANSGTGGAVGGSFTAQGPGTKYAVKLIDNTEGIGKVLTCMTANGEANWADLPTGISGLGTEDYLARWTPDGNTLSTGTTRDNGTSVGINAVPDTNVRLVVSGSTLNGLYSITNKVATGSSFAFGISGASNGISTLGENVGVYGTAGSNTNVNYGVYGGCSGTTTGKNIGLRGVASAGAAGNYAIQLQDGTQAAGKFLKSVTNNGEANWANITSSDTTGATGTFTSQDGKTITVTNGLITNIA